MTRRIALIVVALLLLGSGGGIAYWYTHRASDAGALAIYGNVDLRQVDLPFNDSERIADRAGPGRRPRAARARCWRGSTRSRLEPQVAQAEAQVAAQQAGRRQAPQRQPPRGDRRRPGPTSSPPRPTPPTPAGNTSGSKALLECSAGEPSSQQDVDNAKAALDVAEAKLEVNQKALDLAVAGPRKEDIAQAEAQLRGNEAQLALLRQQLADAELSRRSTRVVRTRLMEPGEMASPQKPVFSLAIIDPKWVRAYVSEPDLGKVRPGMKRVRRGRQLSGPALRRLGRLHLARRRVHAEDRADRGAADEPRLRGPRVRQGPADELRLGMPATVHLPLEPAAAPTAGSGDDAP